MSNPTTPFSWQMPTSTDLVTDLPADFEVFGQAVATSMADLLGGTTGQILSKTSNTDMDFTWIANDQGDITGVTATSPLTGGGTSGAITVGIQDASTTQKGSVQLSDSTSTTSSILAATPTAVKSSYDLAAAAIPKSTVTTNGDIIYGTGSGTVTRLGVGSSGQVLTVASGVPSWATSSSGGMTLLSTTSLSGSSVTVSSLSGSYTNLQIVMKGAYASGDSDLFIRLNSDSGSNYAHYSLQTNDTTASGFYTDSATQVQIGFITGTNTYDKRTDFVMDLPRYTDTSNCFGISTLSTYAFSGRRQIQNFFRYNNSAAITSFTIYPSSGTFSGGSLYIYGVK